MKPIVQFRYLEYAGAELFTVICLPSDKGRFPTMIYRSPYVDAEELLSEEEVCEQRLSHYAAWVEHGYAVVFQHCRGRGKSSGDCVPYIYEREDGLFLQDWIRTQPFYNGELYLYGGSYTSSVHFVTAPFAPDIRGAILEVQDCERYNCNYRNGFYKMGLHGEWYVKMYKHKSKLKKSYTTDSYRMLPLSEFSKTVLGESAEDFDEILRHPDRNDPFWQTRYGGGEAHDAIKHANIPILLVTGFYDIYAGGVFDMWHGLDDQTRAQSALAVHPFEHGGKGTDQPIFFENGVLKEKFDLYPVRWADSVRGKCEPPFARGKVTYYKLFDNKWCCDDFYDAGQTKKLVLGKGSVTYKYNPYAPASFQGGLSTNLGGNAWQNQPNARYDVISLYTEPFSEDTFVKGKIKAKLTVQSDCEDTCFYLRLSLCKEGGDYGLRDDINQISNFDAAYRPGDTLEMDFSFDEHAFVVQNGEKLRIDISSSAYPHYVPHTNQRGLFAEQTTARISTNTVILDRSFLELPIGVSSASISEK
ncbi:MAG: CocE/NonD family hydrolase [Ruminococcaceae bacterium]|nr:CocE/NonD family hydrolase [Oscillospiraceae bacterium]